MIAIIFIILAWVFFGYLAKKITLAALQIGCDNNFNERWKKKDEAFSWFVAIFGPVGLIATSIAWLVYKSQNK